MKYLTTLALVLALASGCASAPPIPPPIQVVQSSDPSLTCAELAAEIQRMEVAAKNLDAHIESEQNAQSNLGFLSAVSSMAGNAPNPMEPMGLSASARRIQSYTELKRNYQQRRDTLMQQYHFKSCS